MLKRIVIADASTIIGLAYIDSLDILEGLYGQIEITSVVRDEVDMPLPSWVKVNDEYNATVFQTLVPNLDDGEASAIALALAQKDSLLIIDEKKGRKFAVNLGLQITGVIGVIIKAREVGIISSGKSKLDGLMDKGFRFSQKIYQLALEKMDEA
ncbi:DUF3368 domain-containing protein [Lewinella sp. 4G2]|uniref:DUF3368 domain-containing protein n=1 Tax=Lewinella sp. 4G2 TaxID=1803372 RepID=UPI0007B46079|nr:DUF3368 domain-containing protein [Lewinella sp. 4G2]OAV43565.1 hypothetical protein A3850_003230 [Lewinella sp. 4G2]